MWWRYHLRYARLETEKAEEAVRVDLAAQWRDLKVKLSDELRALGVDPDKEPEPLLKHLELWVVVGTLILTIFIGIAIHGIRSDLKEFVQTHMERR
jgi:hypothetical protein